MVIQHVESTDKPRASFAVVRINLCKMACITFEYICKSLYLVRLLRGYAAIFLVSVIHSWFSNVLVFEFVTKINSPTFSVTLLIYVPPKVNL